MWRCDNCAVTLFNTKSHIKITLFNTNQQAIFTLFKRRAIDIIK